MSRAATIKRKTSETDIAVELALDGSGQVEAASGIPFMDHMLHLFGKHGFFDLKVTARGDLEVDAHHTMEDLGIALGMALKEALGEKKGIRRYGHFMVPMDETLARVVLDLSGRPCLVYGVPLPAGYHLGGSLDVQLFREFFQALVNQAGMNLHIDVLRGDDVHHKIEAVFKAFARALDLATHLDPREKSVPSTKGTLV